MGPVDLFKQPEDKTLEFERALFSPADRAPSGWQPPEPLHLGRFCAPEEQWREFANVR